MIINQISNLLNKFKIDLPTLFKFAKVEITPKNLLEWFQHKNIDFLERIIKSAIELIDYKLLKSEYVQTRFILKGLFQRTIIFQHGKTTFYRRKYLIKPEYQNKNNPNYVYFSSYLFIY